MTKKQSRCLVAYFSHKGQNYSNGNLIELSKGNTAVAAELLAALTGADLFEIRRATDYPHTYRECVDEARRELGDGTLPPLFADTDTNGYDVLYIGYPNWCGTMPMAVKAFLSGHNLAGKTVYPFCTHEGGGMGRSESDLKLLCPASVNKKGLALHGTGIENALPALKAWIE